LTGTGYVGHHLGLADGRGIGFLAGFSGAGSVVARRWFVLGRRDEAEVEVAAQRVACL
jgi:hypothetical protein